ncbi:MAG TPA: DEAD/DEAH box helicase [Armatimonadota bacterium]|nr:DEAD/DEAH box helicase [Armatimonadota bacterium]
MSYQDRTFVCRDCGEGCTFTARDQKLFDEHGFNPPTRCPDCHDLRVYGPEKPELAADSLIGRDTGITSFEEFKLDSRLERAIAYAGYKTPTPVQSATIPMGLEGRDLIGTAQTGTGKTAAFALPILQHLLVNPAKKPCTRVIVLTPTRELAEQISDMFKQLAKFTKIRIATVYGGVGMGPQEKALRTGAEVIVACPGRLLDHIERGNTNFTCVEKVVLDEADRMLDMGFLPPIKRILSHMPRERHTMLFSATFAPELMQLAASAMKNPLRVEVDLRAPARSVAHALYPCPQHLKTSLVLKLLDDTDTNSVLIFTRTKHRANRVALQIQRAGYKTSALHANKSQSQRQSALDDFRSGRCQILVATDIAARGLDIESISHVINYDIPDTADMYIHRIGRTGRMEREGDAMTLISQDDAGTVWDIEKALGTPIERRNLEGFDYTAGLPPRDEFKRAPMLRPISESRSPATYAPHRSRAKTMAWRKYRSK